MVDVVCDFHRGRICDKTVHTELFLVAPDDYVGDGVG